MKYLKLYRLINIHQHLSACDWQNVHVPTRNSIQSLAVSQRKKEAPDDSDSLVSFNVDYICLLVSVYIRILILVELVAQTIIKGCGVNRPTHAPWHRFAQMADLRYGMDGVIAARQWDGSVP